MAPRLNRGLAPVRTLDRTVGRGRSMTRRAKAAEPTRAHGGTRAVTSATNIWSDATRRRRALMGFNALRDVAAPTG
jgi:hypothetical protein